MILLDSSGLLAALNRSEPAYESARAALEADPGPRVLSPFVLAELDYLLGTRGRPDTQQTLLDDVARASYQLAPFDPADVGEAARIVARYSDLRIGLADASIVVLAGRYGTNRVLTLDERHFRVLRTPGGKPFTVLPADA